MRENGKHAAQELPYINPRPLAQPAALCKSDLGTLIDFQTCAYNPTLYLALTGTMEAMCDVQQLAREVATTVCREEKCGEVKWSEESARQVERGRREGTRST